MKLNRHPFPVSAFLERSLVLAFAAPREVLAPRLPPCLELDLLADRQAFLAVAMVDTRHLRPKGFPPVLGRDFILIGYRIFVRYRGADGRRLRGLYILRSETNRRMMKVLGGLFTQYRYATVGIDWSVRGGVEEVRSRDGLEVVAEDAGEGVALPDGSPFADWREARRFAGPMPHTFSHDPARDEVIIVEGVRSSWSPRPVRIVRHSIPYLETTGLAGELSLANAFLVEKVPYEWKRGRVERWSP